jgi:hypothetical protein
VIAMAGRPDLVAEAYASVFLVASGFAQQSDVARALADRCALGTTVGGSRIGRTFFTP